MEIKQLIGEDKDYDKKVVLETKNPKAGVRASVRLQIVLAES